MAYCAPMTTTTKAKKPPLAKTLPPPSWGWEIKRAREEIAGLTLDQVTEAVSKFLNVTPSTISRLEKLDHTPRRLGQMRQRYLAYLLSLTYGIDPSVFDLDDDDVPPAVLDVVREQGVPSTRWYGDGPPGAPTAHSASAA